MDKGIFRFNSLGVMCKIFRLEIFREQHFIFLERHVLLTFGKFPEILIYFKVKYFIFHHVVYLYLGASEIADILIRKSGFC